MAWDFNFTFLNYTPKLQAHRRMFHQQFRAGVVNKFVPIQLEQIRTALSWMLAFPQDIRKHVRRWATFSVSS